MHTPRLCGPIVAALAATGPALAAPVCGTEGVFELTGVPLPPFWGEVIGVGTLEGTIVSSRIDVTFTATGTFDAAALGFSFSLPIDGNGAGVGFTGADLGWSGQGTFTASFESSALNGDLAITGGGGWYGWNAIISNGAPGAGPITGSFEDMRITVDFQACPAGDLDGDVDVDVDDLVDLILEWGACDTTTCPADLDGDGVVDVNDLVILILNWGDHFCPAPLC